MATQEILLQYKADITDLQAKVALIEQQSRKVGASVKTAQQSAGTGFKNLTSALAPLGAAIAGAFAVNQVIAFGTESVKAFQEAELAARKLQTAVSVSGGLQQDFDGLLNQSKELQEISIFSDEAIQNAQTAALQFGLTSDEVKELIPIIADFASATGQDLNTALSSVLRGLEGQGRGLKLYGINVDSAASRAENLASITDQLTGKFQGQAKIIGETGAGAIARYNNQIDDLKEQLGEQLEPIFLAVTKGAVVFTEAIIAAGEGVGILVDAVVTASNALSGDFTGLLAKGLEDLKALREKAAKENQALTEQFAESFKNLTSEQIQQRLETYRRLLDQTIEKRKESANASAKERSELAQDEVTFRTAINGLKAVIEQRKKQAEANALSEASLRKLSTAELDALKIKLTPRQDTTAKDAIESIKKILEERKKAGAEAAKQQAAFNEARKQAQKKADDELLQLTIDQIKNDFEQRREQSELNFSRFEKDKEEQLKQGLINQETRNALVKAQFQKHQQELADIKAEETQFDRDESLKNRLADIDKFNAQEILKLQQAFIAKGDFSEKAQEDLNDAIAAQELQALQERLIAVRNAGGDILDLQSQIAEKQIAINDKKNKAIIAQEKEAAEAQAKLFDQINEAYAIMAEGIKGASDAILGGQIESLQAQTDANKEFFDRQQEEIQDSVSKRLITESQGEVKSANLKQKRVESEKKSNEEIKSLKRQQAEIDKLLSIFRIGLLLAEAIAEVNPFKIAAASVQLGVVVATPIPRFRYGESYVERGKNKPGIDTIPALLNEGERIVPTERNLKHWDLYEAIDKDQIEQYVMRHYITPELKKQQKTFEENKQKTFAENIGQSLIYNGLTYHEADKIRRKGTKIANEESLAKTIAKEVAKAITRQTIYDR